jgi:hypothetical protein
MPYKDKEVQKLKSAERYARNKEAYAARAKEYNLSLTDEQKTIRAIKQRDHNLKRDYNISSIDYNEMFNNQNGRCAICDIHQNDLRIALAVDHSHVTNKIRGLLCDRCNRGIGFLQDLSSNCLKAYKYLKEFENEDG